MKYEKIIILIILFAVFSTILTYEDTDYNELITEFNKTKTINLPVYVHEENLQGCVVAYSYPADHQWHIFIRKNMFFHRKQVFFHELLHEYLYQKGENWQNELNLIFLEPFLTDIRYWISFIFALIIVAVVEW